MLVFAVGTAAFDGHSIACTVQENGVLGTFRQIKIFHACLGHWRAANHLAVIYIGHLKVLTLYVDGIYLTHLLCSFLRAGASSVWVCIDWPKRM